MFLGGTGNASAQTDSAWKPLKIIPVTAEDFTADPLGNLYLLSGSGQVKKINENGDSLGVLNISRKYGQPALMDASYPLKILFFYPPYVTLLAADRFLNLLNTVDLKRSGLFLVKAIAPSYDGQYWAYDEQEARLVKINDQAQVTAQTAGFRQLFDEPPLPVKIIDHNGLVYLYDTAKGIYVFDYYGTAKTQIPLAGLTNVHAFNKTIYGLRNGMLIKHQLDNPLTDSFPLPADYAGVKKMVVTYNRLYLMVKDRIYILPVQ